MLVRISSHPVPRFCHDGLVVTEAWSAIDWEAADEKVRAAVRKFHGRFLRTHPSDVAKWAEVGLRIVDGRLVPIAKAAAVPVVDQVEESEPEVASPPPARQPRAPRTPR
jgi:hypothetical protein